MNSLYIGIGVTIIVALLAALVGPFFIDWTLFRSSFEREGERIFGARMTVLGDIQARLLPSPSISLGDVVLGSLERPAGKIARFDMQLELTPLLKGEVRVLDMRLERPSVRVTLRRNGTLGLGADAAPVAAGDRLDVSGTSIEAAEIVDGRIDLVDERAGRTLAIERVNAIVSAAALVGPLKADGGAEAAGHGFAFKIATGRETAEGGLPLKLQITPNAKPVVVTIDSALKLRGTQPNGNGTLTVQGIGDAAGKADRGDTGPMPWRVESRFAVDSARLKFEQLAVTVGPEDRSYSLTGQGHLDVGAVPGFDLALSAKQIDLDRALAGKVGQAVEVQRAVARAAGLLQVLPVPGIAGRLVVEVPGVVIAGGVVQDVKLIARPRPGGLTIDEVSAKLPGRTQMTASGRLSTGAEPVFDGRFFVASEQPASFAAWFRSGSSPSRLDPVSIDASVRLGGGGFRAEQILARLGSAQAKGWFQTTAGPRGTEVDTAITADRLDLDQVKALASLFSGPSEAVPAATRLSLDAGQVVLGGVTLRGVAATVALEGERIAVDRFSVQDAAGAVVEASGRLDGLASRPDGAIEARIKAGRVDGLVRVLRLIAPDGALSDRLGLAAPHLAPLDITAKLTGTTTADAGDLRLAVNGSASGSTLTFDGHFAGSPSDWRNGRVTVQGVVEGPDGGLVMRQLGLPAFSGQGPPGRATITASGVAADGLDASTSLEAFGTRVGLEGRIKATAEGKIGLEGRAAVKSDDIGAALTALGQAVASPAERVPVDLRAEIAGTWPRVLLKPLEGRAADIAVRSEAVVDFGLSPVRLEGRVETGPLDVATLLELGLGAGTLEGAPAKGGVWPVRAIGGPVLQGVSADLAFAAEQLTLSDGRTVDRPSFRLRIRPGELGLEDFNGRLAGGTATGQMRFRAGSTGEVSASGDLKLQGVALEAFVWRRDGRPVATGLLDVTTTFETAGRSVSALMSGLTGGGALSIRKGIARYVNPDAFTAIIAAADQGLELKEDRIRTVFQSHLDSGTLPFERLEAAFSLGGGVVRLREMAVESPRANTSGTATFDLSRWTLEADWSIKVDPGRNGVTGAEPVVGVVFRGPLDQPSRTLDVAPLNAFLTLRTFEREVNRVETLQQDILERERFGRELRRIREERVRAEREAEARKAEEERRAREADAARRAEEEAKRREAAEAEAVRRRRAEEVRRAEEARRVEDISRRAEEERRRALTPPVGGTTGTLPPLAPPIAIGPAPDQRTAPPPPPPPPVVQPAPRAPFNLFSPNPNPIPPAPIGRP